MERMQRSKELELERVQRAKVEEMERLRRQQIKAEHDRRIKLAELEISLYEGPRDTEDELSDNDEADLCSRNKSKFDLTRPATSVHATTPEPFLSVFQSTQGTSRAGTGLSTSVTDAPASAIHAGIRSSVRFSTVEVSQPNWREGVIRHGSYYNPIYTWPAPISTSARLDAEKPSYVTRSENMAERISGITPTWTPPVETGMPIRLDAIQASHSTHREVMADRSYTASQAVGSYIKSRPYISEMRHENCNNPQFCEQRLRGDTWRGYYPGPLIPKPNVTKFESIRWITGHSVIVLGVILLIDFL